MNETTKKEFTVNPTVLMLLGATFAVSSTTNVISALYVGIAVTLVTVLSQLIISIVKKALEPNAQFAVTMLLTAGLASTVEMLTHALFPQIYSMVGIYISLLAVNLITLYRCEVKAMKAGFGAAIWDGIVSGLCFTIAILVIACLREVFGSGSFAGTALSFMSGHTVPLLARAPGGYMILAFVMAVSNAIFPADRVSFGNGIVASALFEGTNENTCVEEEKK